MFDDAGSTIMSILYGVADPSDQLRRIHMEQFATQYTEPLVSYLIKVRGQPEDLVRDVVQSFWMKKLIEPKTSENIVSKYLSLYREQTSKSNLNFRSYLCTSIKRFLIDQLRSHKHLASLDYMEGIDLITVEDERGFDGIWANQILRRTVLGVQSECASNQQSGMWQLFLRQVLLPNLYSLKPPGYAELSQQLGYSDSKQASNAVRTVLRKFQNHLKHCIEDYLPVDASADRTVAIQNEANEILRVLSDPHSLDHELFEEIVKPFISTDIKANCPISTFSFSGGTQSFLQQPEESLYGTTQDLHCRWKQLMETEVYRWLDMLNELAGCEKSVRFLDVARAQKLPLDLLNHLRNVAKKASKQQIEEPVEILSTIYHLAIASAYINYGQVLSSDPIAKIRNRVQLLLKADWIDGNTRSLFSEFITHNPNIS